MQYRDVYGVIPGSYLWRTPSPGSHKPTPESDPDIFKWDYKTPYRESIYFVRRFLPDLPNNSEQLSAYKMKQEDFDKVNSEYPSYKDCFDKPGKYKYFDSFENKTTEELKEIASNIVNYHYEARNELMDCNIF
jgi:hypothetical protein